MKKTPPLVVLFFFLSVYPAAAESPGPIVLNEERAVRYALENNVGILFAAEEIEAAGARASETLSGFLPHLRATGHYTRSKDHPYIPFEENSGYRLEVTQNIFTGGELTGRRAAAASSLDAAKHAREEIAGKVRYEARKAFFASLFSAEVLRIREEALRLAEEMLETIRLRFEKGEASNYELLRQKVEAANIRSRVSRSRNHAESELNNLKMVLGLPPEDAVVLNGELTFFPAEKDPAEMKALAIRSRPRLKEINFLYESAEMTVRAARSGYYPWIFFDAANIANKNEPFDPGGEKWKNYWEARISVTVPIFRGGATRARVNQAKAEARGVRILLDQAKKDVKIEVENALLDISSSAERVSFQKENVDTANEAYSIISERYLIGKTSHLDVMDARLALSEAELNYADSLREHSAARARLEFAVGETVFEKENNE